jgi:SAM-dependent methyltransferase
MVRPRTFVILAGTAAAAVAVLRHGHRATQGHRVAGGILIGHAGVYDTMSRLLLGSFAERIAADVAAVAPAGARVLEVGCGPGHLSIQLTRQHGFDVTGLDLDSAMIARARANADRPANGDRRRPALLVGDVAALAFPLSRMTCPPAEPVQLLFNGKPRHASASRHAPYRRAPRDAAVRPWGRALRGPGWRGRRP